MNRCRARGDDGVVLVVVALLLVSLLTFTAIVVDLGNGRQTRRQAQNAVDAAALAAATLYQPDNAGSRAAAMNEGMRYLQVNGIPAPSTATADQYSYNCTGGQTCVVEFSFEVTDRCVSISVRDLRVNTRFAPVIGADRLNIGSDANGCVREGPDTPPPDLPATFTGGTCGSAHDKAFKTSGNHNLFEGGIHSNHGIMDNGNSNTATGDKTRVGNEVQNNGLWTPNTQVPTKLWPIDPNVVTHNLYRRTGSIGAQAHALGLHYEASGFDLSGSQPAGIYYSTANEIKLDGVQITPVTVGGVTYTGATFVTVGKQIELSGTASHVTPWDLDENRIVLFSAWSEKSGAERCDSETVKFGGECNHFDGVVFAPYGKVRLSGNGNGHSHNGRTSCDGHAHGGLGGGTNHQHTNWNGGVVSWAFESSGERHLLRGGPSGAWVPGTEEPYLDE